MCRYPALLLEISTHGEEHRKALRATPTVVDEVDLNRTQLESAESAQLHDAAWRVDRVSIPVKRGAVSQVQRQAAK